MQSQSRTLEEIKAEILRRAGKVNPFEKIKQEDVEEVVNRLQSLDPDHWGAEWGRIGDRYEALGDGEEKRGQMDAAGKA